MNLQEARVQFPQYADIPDREFATALHQKFYSDMPAAEFFSKVGLNTRQSAADQIANDPITRGAQNFADEISPGGRFLMGAGAGMANLGRGAAQLVGMGPSEQETAETRKRDEPLLRTPMGQAGSMTGQMAAFAPMMMAGPAAATVGGAAALGAVAGGMQPGTPEEKLAHMAGGAALGGGIQWGTTTLPTKIATGDYGLPEALKNVMQRRTEGGRDIMGAREANRIVGPERRDAVIEALARNRAIVPGEQPIAGEAAVPARSAEFAALQKRLEKRLPSEYDDRLQLNTQKRLEAVQPPQNTPERLAAAIKARDDASNAAYGAIRNDVIDPRSEQQIMDDAIAGRFRSKADALQQRGQLDTMAAQQETLANGGVVAPSAGGRGNVSPSAYPVEGMPRVPARLTDNAERIAEAQSGAGAFREVSKERQAEMEFLTNLTEQLKGTVGLESRSLRDFLARPSGQRAVREAMEGAAERGESFNPYTIGSLQRIKQAIQDEIKKPETGLGATQKAEITRTLSDFVEVLSKRSPAWAAARQEHRLASGPINEMQIEQALANILKKPLADEGANPKLRSDMFAAALRDPAKTMKDATGYPGFERFEQTVSPDKIGSWTKAGESLARQSEYERLAQLGASKVAEQFGKDMAPPRLTGMFSRNVTITNAILNAVEGKNAAKIMDQMAKNMQTPERMAELMRVAAGRDRAAEIAKAVLARMKPQATPAPAIAGALMAE